MGFVHMTPFMLEQTLSITRMTMYNWHGSPGAMAVSGTGEDGERVLVTSMERALDYSIPRTKQAMETLHVQRFRSDCAARGPGDPIRSITFNPSDPPDFLVEDRSGTTLGLECTRFGLKERLDLHGRIDHLKRSIISDRRERYSKLRGSVVYVGYQTFGLGDAEGKTRAVIESILSMLRDLEPARTDVAPRDPLPDPAPDIGMERDAYGSTVHAVPLEPTHQPSTFMYSTGFEIGLIQTSSYSMNAVWDDITARVASKDESGNDWILISAGAPDRAGRFYPLEGVLASFAVDEPRSLSPRFASRVTLHSWTSGQAWDLHPVFGQLARAPGESPPGPALHRTIDLIMPEIRIPETLTAARNSACPCGSGRTFKHCHGAAL